MKSYPKVAWWIEFSLLLNNEFHSICDKVSDSDIESNVENIDSNKNANLEKERITYKDALDWKQQTFRKVMEILSQKPDSPFTVAFSWKIAFPLSQERFLKDCISRMEESFFRRGWRSLSLIVLTWWKSNGLQRVVVIQTHYHMHCHIIINTDKVEEGMERLITK